MLLRFIISLLLLAGFTGTESLAHSAATSEAHQTEWLSQKSKQATGFPFKWQTETNASITPVSRIYARISKAHEVRADLLLKQSALLLPNRPFVKQHRPQCLYNLDTDPVAEPLLA